MSINCSPNQTQTFLISILFSFTAANGFSTRHKTFNSNCLVQVHKTRFLHEVQLIQRQAPTVRTHTHARWHFLLCILRISNRRNHTRTTQYNSRSVYCFCHFIQSKNSLVLCFVAWNPFIVFFIFFFFLVRTSFCFFRLLCCDVSWVWRDMRCDTLTLHELYGWRQKQKQNVNIFIVKWNEIIARRRRRMEWIFFLSLSLAWTPEQGARERDRVGKGREKGDGDALFWFLRYG